MVALLAAFGAVPAAAAVRWAGHGDGVSWSNAANWETGVVPGPSDDVLLDNSLVAGDYAVTLPGGAVTTRVDRLTLAPSGTSITVTLPASSTANPGLSAGDGVAGTDDIVIGAGATLVNQSSAINGNGIEANSVSNGTVRIDDGGRYLHATLRSAAGIAPLLSTAPGTEHGEFAYDVPGNQTYNITMSGRTYGSLTLSRSSGPYPYGALGSSDARIRGTFSLLGAQFNSTMTGTLRLLGNFTNEGALVTIPASQAVSFEGVASQTITGGLTLNGPATIASGATLVVASNEFFAEQAFQVNGTLEIVNDTPPGGVGTFAYDPKTASLVLDPPSIPVAIGSGPTKIWPASQAPSVVVVEGAGATLSAARSVSQLVACAAPLQHGEQLTVNGTLELRAGASVSGAPTYGAGATLRYAAPLAVGAEWGPGAQTGVGVPFGVSVDPGAGTVQLPASNRRVPGDLAVTSGTLACDPATGDLYAAGNVTIAGTLDTHGRPLHLVGTGTQALGGPAPVALPALAIAKSLGEAQLGADLTLAGGTPALAFDGSDGDVLDLNGHALTLGGPIGGGNSAGALFGEPTASLDLVATAPMGLVSFVGSGATLHRLRVNGPTSTVVATIAGGLVVRDSLVLDQGVVSTGGDLIGVDVGGVVRRTAGWVAGTLRRKLAAGATVSATFDVGDSLHYAPASLAFDHVTATGTLAVTTAPGDDPALATSAIDPAHSVNRTWTLAGASGLAFDRYAATLGYAAADVDAGADPQQFGMGRYQSGAWTLGSPVAHTATSTQATGLTGLGDLAVGQVPSQTLTLASAGHGAVAASPSQPTYLRGTTVQVTAIPDPGFHLDHWSGDASGAANPLYVTLLTDASITATFVADSYTLAISVTGNGTVGAVPDQASYAYGDSVTLTATPGTGWHFAGWSGGAAGNANPLALAMTSDLAITATFAPDTFPVTVTVTGSGTVTRQPDQAFYPYGSSVTLTAVPVTGWHFVTWGGDAAGGTSPVAIAIDGAKSVSATFAVDSHTLTTPVVGSGTVARAPDQPSYPYGTAVTLTATPAAGWQFAGWSGDTTAAANPLTVAMIADRTITATFQQITYTLTVNVVGGGTVLRDPDQPAYPAGADVQLTAASNPGQVFAGWSGDVTSFANPLDVTMSANLTLTATFVANTPKYWTGLGDGASWSDGANWIRGTPPAASDEVVLDNQYVAGSYTVTLPGGATSVAVRRLSIVPSGAATVKLVLPATNTANPGFSAGDSLAGTDDILIGPNGVLVNASGASTGNGIQAATLGNGGVRIEDGGRYVHQTYRSAGGIVPLLSTAAGTEHGVFEYDVPGTPYNINASGRTYGDLTLTHSSGPGTYGALGASPLRVRGALTLNSGVTLQSTMTGTLQLEGDVTNDGAPIVIPSGQPVAFQGSAPQHLAGASSLTVTGSTTIAAGATLALGTTPFSNAGTVVVFGTLQIGDGAYPGGAGTWVYDATAGTLAFANASGPLSLGKSIPYWPASNPPAIIRVAGAGGVSFDAARTIGTTLVVAAPVVQADSVTITGTLELDGGGTLDGAPLYAGAAPTLRYAVGGSPSAEWGAGSAVGTGVPDHVTVDVGSGVLQLPTDGRTVPGNLTVASGTLALDPLGGDLSVGGNVAVTGGGVFATHGHALGLTGNAIQTLSGAAGLTLDYLRLYKQSGSVTMLSDLVLQGPAGPALEWHGGPGDVLDLNGHALTIQSVVTGSNPAGRLRGTATSTLHLGGSGDLDTLSFLGGAQTLGTLDVNIANGGHATLGTPLTVTGLLSLGNGRIVTAGGALTAAAGAVVTRGAGWVDGALAKPIGTGAGAGASFEIGSASGYAPVAVTFHQVATGGTLTASTTGAEHPQIATAGLDAAHDVNRYWTLGASGMAFDSSAVVFTFPSTDVDAGADPLGFDVRRYAGSAWSHTTPGAHTATTAAASGITAFGDFATGRPLVYTLTLAATSGGAVAASPNQTQFEPGASVTLTATSQPGYHFTGWSGGASGSTNPLGIVMSSDLSITANFAVNGVKKWVGASGGGDGASWSSAGNWSDGAVPIAGEQVLLDNSTVTGSYSVTLPAGAVTTTIQRLTITPAIGRTIALTLPATSTANPGLVVGDGVAGTDDIVLSSGATLRNATGAATGAGVALAGASDDVRIGSGGHYVHATLRSPSTIVAALSTATGTETGEFQYDVPGTASFAIDLAGRTYGSLSLTRSAGSATYTANGSSPITIRGDLRTDTGVTFTSTMTGALRLDGNLTVNGAALTLPSGQAVTFGGNGVQVVSGSALATVNGASTVAAGATLTLANTFNAGGALTVHGTLQMNPSGVLGGSGTVSYDATTGTLVYNNTAAVSVANTSREWPTTNGPVNVTLLGAGGVTLQSSRTIPGLLQLGATLSRGTNVTVSGTVQLNAGGAFATSAPRYSGSATLVYAAAAAVGLEWTSGTSVGQGVPKNVVVQAGTVTLPNTDRNVVGSLTIASGATLALNATAGNLVLRGNGSVSGTLATNGRTLSFAGTATQTLSSGSALSVDVLQVNKTGGRVQLLTDVTARSTGSATVSFDGTTDVLDLNGHTLTLAGGIGGADAGGKLSGSATSVLAFTGTGALGNVLFAAGGQALKHLTLSGTAPTLTLASSLTLSGTLGLGAARVTVASGDTLAIATGGAVTRTIGFVIGALQKPVPAGSAVAVAYEIGSGTTYAPVSLTFGAVTAEGAVTASTATGDHAKIATSQIDPNHSVNRTWTLANAGTAFDGYTATWSFASSDVDAGADPNLFLANLYNGTTWSPLTVSARTATTTQASGMTGFGDVQLGDPAQFPVTVTSVGNGSAARNPDQALYAYGATVTLTATPQAGNAFVSWSGDTTTTTNPLTLVVTRSRSLTATFTYTLGVAVTGSGAVARNPNQPSYAPGTVVALTATPGTGYHFVNWTGDANGGQNPFSLTMDGNKSVTANFALNTYAVSLTSVGNGSAAIAPNNASYAYGTPVTLTATPQAGNAFVGWSGDTTTTTNPLSIVVTRDRSFTAVFTYTLSLIASGPGTASASPAQPNYAPGTAVTVTATPNPNAHFLGWSGDTTATSPSMPLTMEANRSLTATFQLNSYALAVTSVGSGSATPNPQLASYPYGTAVTLTANPTPGNTFLGWSGDTTDAANPLTVVVTRDRSITATFTVALATPVTGSGSVGRMPDAATYPPGTVVALTATPATGWHFVGWSGDASGAANPLSVTLSADRTIGATFAVDSVTLAVSVSGSGSVAEQPSGTTFAYGTVVTLTATPGTGQHFVGWSGDASGAANPLAVTLTGNTSILAAFAPDTFPVAVSATGGGAVSRSPDRAFYAYGTSVTLTATPDPSHHFVGWSGDASGATNPLVVTVQKALTITATFDVDSYPVTTSASGPGTVARQPDLAAYPVGTAVTLTATPNTGAHFVAWSGDTTATTASLSLVVTRARTLTATFALDTHTLVADSTAGGRVTRSPSQAHYDYGTVVTLTATPDPYHHFVGWTGDASGATNPLSVTVTADLAITGVFAPDSYTVVVHTSGSGSVTRSPDRALYPALSQVTLTAVPGTGYSFSGWMGDVEDATNPLTLTLDHNVSLIATFDFDGYVLSTPIAGKGAVLRSPDSLTYHTGTTVQLVALGMSGYSFVGWSGDTTATVDPLTFVVNRARTIVATFADTTAPAVTALTPGGGAPVSIGSAVTLRWSAQDGDGVALVDLRIVRADAGGKIEEIASSAPNTGSFTWTVTAPASESAYLQVVAQDSSGNVAVATSDSAFAIQSPTAAPAPTPVLELALLPVAPNPVRDGARLRFDLPAPTRVRLAVLDVTGREVARLVDGDAAAGRHELRWEGVARDGRRAPAGVYFLRLDAGPRRLVQRFALSR